MPSAPAIAARGVTVRYGDVLALESASLSIAPGRVTGLVGMNGSGKSTLLKALTGMVRPDEGEIELLGHSVSAARAHGLIGYMPQSEDIDPTFPISVRDVVMMGCYGALGLTRRPRAADRAAVAEALERVELSDLAGRQIGQLSGGQRKRAFLARAIAQGRAFCCWTSLSPGSTNAVRPRSCVCCGSWPHLAGAS